MANIHDLAREYLAKDGLKIRDTQKAGVFLFADWLLANGYAAQQGVQADAAYCHCNPSTCGTIPGTYPARCFACNLPRR